MGVPLRDFDHEFTSAGDNAWRLAGLVALIGAGMTALNYGWVALLKR